jgi:hypothetical protein
MLAKHTATDGDHKTIQLKAVDIVTPRGVALATGARRRRPAVILPPPFSFIWRIARGEKNSRDE